MYGLLLENLATFIKSNWGEGKWESVRRHAGIDTVAFSIHHVYTETLIQRLSRSAFKVLGVGEREFFEAMGVYFVQYVSQYGYDQILSVLGRHLRDFLNGLDNLHEYLKFSYPKMRAPSFYCDDETNMGLKLHYRSKRRGFVYYVMGQIKQVANQFYSQECEIALLKEELVGETMHVIFQLTFDNSAFTEAEAIKSMIGQDLRLPVQAATLFELFPFCVVFNCQMEITHTGHALMAIVKDLIGQIMTEAFDMTRPLIPFCFAEIMQRRNNIFELLTVAPLHDINHLKPWSEGEPLEEQNETEGIRLRLRGQMMYMEEWNMMLFLANPVMPDLNSLVDAGLFINDLSLHDCSRDLVLAGTQQSVELKLALDQEQQKSRKLVESMKKLDEEMRRTDQLLYQMIPKQVADRIRKGENPVNTCETFEVVSILFSDVVNFTDICSNITPMQVVTMLNHMYSLFDQLTERNGVYKVETIGDSYMVVSGAPIQDLRHGERICEMALDMVDASEAIQDPCEEDKGLRIRVGCHSGTVVAGVVGVKMPRYCLFGDTVNTASRMESTSEAGKIQISEACKNLLPIIYDVQSRGTVSVKGKGNLNTYWLLGRDSRVPLSKLHSKSIIWTAPESSSVTEAMIIPFSPDSAAQSNGLDPGTIQRKPKVIPKSVHPCIWKSAFHHSHKTKPVNISQQPHLVLSGRASSLEPTDATFQVQVARQLPGADNTFKTETHEPGMRHRLLAKHQSLCERGEPLKPMYEAAVLLKPKNVLPHAYVSANPNASSPNHAIGKHPGAKTWSEKFLSNCIFVAVDNPNPVPIGISPGSQSKIRPERPHRPSLDPSVLALKNARSPSLLFNDQTCPMLMELQGQSYNLVSPTSTKFNTANSGTCNLN